MDLVGADVGRVVVGEAGDQHLAAVELLVGVQEPVAAPDP